MIDEPSRDRRHPAGRAAKNLPVIRRLLSENLRRYLVRYLAAFVAMGVVSAATAASAWGVKFIVNDIFLARDERMVQIMAGAVIAIYVAKGVASYVYMVLLATIGNDIVARSQMRLYARIVAQGTDFFDTHGLGDLLTRMSHNAQAAREALDMIVVSVGRDAFSLIGLVAVMLTQRPDLFLITALVGPPAIWGLVKLGRRMQRVARVQFDALSELSALLKETVLGIRVVKAFLLAPAMRSHMEAVVGSVARSANEMARVKARTSPLMEALGGLAVAGVILYGGLSITRGGQDPGSLVSFIAALLLAYEPAKRLARLHVTLEGHLLGVRLMYEIIDMDSGERDAPDARFLPVDAGAVAFRDVHFAYQGREAALRGVTFTAEAGKLTAIVGASGAGKSTLFALIARFHTPDRGTISIDGRPLEAFTLASLRAQIALVTQEVHLFSGTVRENIAMGREGVPDHEGARRGEKDASAIEHAAREANAHDFIMALGEGYDTEIGEDGARLSGGQRQRIAIARAMVRDAPILLLDEPTSALDAESERAIQEALSRLMRDRTTIVIAHRLSTVRDADCIHVLDAGRIAESGTHEALLARGGLYRRLYDLQFREGG